MTGRVDSRGSTSIAAALAIAFVALLIPASAAATVSCTFAGGTMTVSVDTDGHTVYLDRQAGPSAAIRVNNNDCVPAATTTTTDEIVIGDSAADHFVNVELDLENGGFAPGASLEAGAAPEIEIKLDLGDDGDGFDTLDILDSEVGVADVIRAGETGFNLNAGNEPVLNSPDVDLTNLAGGAIPPVAGFITVTGGNGNDELKATGGLGTGSVLSSRGLILNGNAGTDELTGGSAGDRLQGDSGDDLLDGGGGGNVAFHEGAPGPVSVNLGISGPQNTGAAGTDTITNIANVRGGPFGDQLTGNAAINGIAGAAGADTVRGGLGDDSLSATEDPSDPPEGDTLAFDVAGAAAGVNVDLNGNGTVSGGQGSDTIGNMIFGHRFVNVIGSPLDDTIVGDFKSQTLAGGAGADSITGALGNDSLFGDAGFDSLLAADGLADNVACGPDLASFSIDTALDAVAADCTPAPAAPITPATTTATASPVGKKCKKGFKRKKGKCKRKRKKR